MMEIKDLKPRMGKVEIVVTVKEIFEPREFQKFGKSGKVASAIAVDKTGQVKMSLWNEQVDEVSEGDKVAIKNGYVSEWQGEMQLTTGRFGSLEVVGEATADEETEAEVANADFDDKGDHIVTDDEKVEEEVFEEDSEDEGPSEEDLEDKK